MQLYKLTNKILHFYWAVLSLVLQGTSDPELGAKASFPLAKRMLEKLGRFQTEGQLRLYLLVLERLKEFDEAFMALMRADYQEARNCMWDLDLAETHYLQVRKDVPYATPSLVSFFIPCSAFFSPFQQC